MTAAASSPPSPPLQAARYHSLVVAPTALPDCLAVNATAPTTGRSRAFATATLPIHGLQFHPESIASEHGHACWRNFLALCVGGGISAGAKRA
jgi:anthranilate synthase component 2